MSMFDDAIQAAGDVFMDVGGVTVTYVPPTGGPRAITARVYYEPVEDEKRSVPAKGRGRAYRILADVRNHATLGVVGADVAGNPTAHALTVPPAPGAATTVVKKVRRVVGMDVGEVTLELE